jgi:hypothetical protein
MSKIRRRRLPDRQDDRRHCAAPRRPAVVYTSPSYTEDTQKWRDNRNIVLTVRNRAGKAVATTATSSVRKSVVHEVGVTAEGRAREEFTLRETGS